MRPDPTQSVWGGTRLAYEQSELATVGWGQYADLLIYPPTQDLLVHIRSQVNLSRPTKGGQVVIYILMLMKASCEITILIMITHPTNIICAKRLRKNMSDTERRFWYQINNNKLGVKFRRQQPFGPYCVDFVCNELKLVIELDGNQHAETIEYDNKRTAFIESQGYKLIRIANAELTQRGMKTIVDTLRMCINEHLDFNNYFVSRWE